jgi:hypothetical protein
MQQATKHAIVAKFRVGQHPSDGDATRPDLPQQRQRLAPLFLKRDRRRDARARPRRGGDPRLGQVQRAAEQIGAGPGPQRGGDGHLAIGDLPQRSAVLTRHADRVHPLFGETRAIDDHQTFAFGNPRAQATPDRVGTPRRIGDEMLEGLVRARVGDARQHRFHGFARAVAEQPLHVPSEGEHLRAMAEAHVEGFEPRHQPTQLQHRAAIRHGSAEYQTPRTSTMSSNSITPAITSQPTDLTK